MNGLELMSACKRREPRLKTLLVSDYPLWYLDHELEKAAVQPDAYLYRAELNLTQFVQTVEKLLATEETRFIK